MLPEQVCFYNTHRLNKSASDSFRGRNIDVKKYLVSSVNMLELSADRICLGKLIGQNDFRILHPLAL